MKEIQLTQGKVAIVDDEDYPELLKYKWCAYKGGNTFYAARASPRDPITHKSSLILMHAVIAGTPKGMETDHINGNGLDNRRENLRVATRRENMQNWHPPKTSRFPGVNWDKGAQKWRAQIEVNGKNHHLGLYSDEDAAARRYQIACDWQVIEL